MIRWLHCFSCPLPSQVPQQHLLHLVQLQHLLPDRTPTASQGAKEKQKASEAVESHHRPFQLSCVANGTRVLVETPYAMGSTVAVVAVRRESSLVAGARKDCTSVQSPAVVLLIRFKIMASDARVHPLITRFGLASMLNRPS